MEELWYEELIGGRVRYGGVNGWESKWYICIVNRKVDSFNAGFLY